MPTDLNPIKTLAWRTTFAAFIGLIALGIAWEIWLAPARPGGSLLALKVVPLVLALPSIFKGSRYSFQWWSMLILIYLTEGLVRATSDKGLSANLAIVEVVLATLAFTGILLYTRVPKKALAKNNSGQ